MGLAWWLIQHLDYQQGELDHPTHANEYLVESSKTISTSAWHAKKVVVCVPQ
jgi:hypothetical protein